MPEEATAYSSLRLRLRRFDVVRRLLLLMMLSWTGLLIPFSVDDIIFDRFFFETNDDDDDEAEQEEVASGGFDFAVVVFWSFTFTFCGLVMATTANGIVW